VQIFVVTTIHLAWKSIRIAFEWIKSIPIAFEGEKRIRIAFVWIKSIRIAFIIIKISIRTAFKTCAKSNMDEDPYP